MIASDFTRFGKALQDMRQRAVDPDRAERAENVRAEYKIDELTPALYMVQHPTEDDRSYLVDLAQDTCECPDFACRANDGGFACKHLITCYAVTGRPMPVERTYTASAFIERGRRQRLVLRIDASAKTAALNLVVAQTRAIGGVWDRNYAGWVFVDPSDIVAASVVKLFPNASIDANINRMCVRYNKTIESGNAEPLPDFGFKAGFRELAMSEKELESHFGLSIEQITKMFNQ